MVSDSARGIFGFSGAHRPAIRDVFIHHRVDVRLGLLGLLADGGDRKDGRLGDDGRVETDGDFFQARVERQDARIGAASDLGALQQLKLGAEEVGRLFAVDSAVGQGDFARHHQSTARLILGGSTEHNPSLQPETDRGGQQRDPPPVLEHVPVALEGELEYLRPFVLLRSGCRCLFCCESHRSRS